jgi:hypothetical protein
MTLNSVMGLISSVALFLPVVLILALRLGRYRSFPALLIYYILVFIYNLFTENYINVNEDFVRYWGLSNNLLDAPLMLFFLTYFSPSPALTKQMRILIVLLLVFDAIVIALRGFNINSLTIIMAPGLLIVFAFCLYFFVRQSKITIMHRKATGKALIAASLLFAYGCYGILYLLYYVFNKARLISSVEDTFLVYFLVTIFSSIIICTGIILERKRVQKLNELKITRKELSMMYKETKPGNPLKTAMLDFDKEQWN